MEIKLKEKDKIINNLQIQINKTNNSPNNNFQANRISELEDEINKLKTYFLSPGDKLISIKLIVINLSPGDKKYILNFFISSSNSNILLDLLLLFDKFSLFLI